MVPTFQSIHRGTPCMGCGIALAVGATCRNEDCTHHGQPGVGTIVAAFAGDQLRVGDTSVVPQFAFEHVSRLPYTVGPCGST